jgi:hypothetical protein
MIKKIYKTLLTTMLLSNSVNATECNYNDLFKSNGEFLYKMKEMKIYNQDKHIWIDTKRNEAMKFYNCTIDNRNLFMFLYRDELPNILLIQFIFKSSNAGFLEFSEKFVSSELMKTAISKLKSDKPIILEINTNQHLELRYDIENGKIVSYQYNKSSKK